MSNVGKFARAHDRLRKLQGSASFEYKGHTIPCLCNSFSRRTMVVVGGQEIEADLILYVKKTEFVGLESESLEAMETHLPIPRAGYSLVWGGHRFKVETVHDANPHHPESILQIVCVDYNS